MIATAILVNVGVSIGLMAAQGMMTPLMHGLKYGLGPRDEARPRGVLAGRLDRTVQNQIEATCIFIPIAFLALFYEVSSDLAIWGAGLFAVSRIAFVLLYVSGIPVVRSLAFTGALTGIVMLLIGIWPSLPL